MNMISSQFDTRIGGMSKQASIILFSLLLMMFVVGACTEANAFVVQQINNKYERWLATSMPVQYRIYRGPAGDLPLEWIPAMTSAFDAWTAVGTASVSFQYGGTTSTGTVGKDGQNVVIWVTEDAKWPYGPNVSAYTTTYVNGSTGVIDEFDIEINATPSWLATRPWSIDGEPDKMDLQDVLTHEVGHVIGLDHVEDPEATMYGVSDLGVTKRRTLGVDDEQGASFIYPLETLIFEIVSGNDQAGTPGVALPEALKVRITDGSGWPVAGQFVIFDIRKGYGTLDASAPVETRDDGTAETVFTPEDAGKTVIRAVGPGLTEKIFWVNNNAPVLSWAGDVNYESDGLHPETGDGYTNFVFRVRYADADDDQPAAARVWIDADGDGIFETDEKFIMHLSTPPPFSAGVIYRAIMRLPFSSGSSNIKYYFEFRDRIDLPPAGGLSYGFSPATAIDAPDVLQVEGNTAPVFFESDPQTVVMDQDGDPTAFSLTLNATDGEGNAIYWGLSSQAMYGTAAVSGTGTQKSIAYTPHPGFNGLDTFTVLVYDYLGGTDTLTIVVIIDPPMDWSPDPVEQPAYTLWDDFTVPSIASNIDGNPVELGVKFQSALDGFITGILFYKGTMNTGTHVGNLWTREGNLLGSVTFLHETASGWQYQELPAAVPIRANTTYVVSYHTGMGGYAVDAGYFADAWLDSWPLRALSDGEDGPNGVYKYGESGFPSNSYCASNYWVDVAFRESLGPDTKPPLVTSVFPASGSVNVDTETIITVIFSEPMDPAKINILTLELRDSAGVIPAVVTYESTAMTATLDPSSSLTPETEYIVRVVGGEDGVTDIAGNPLTDDYTWSFTTIGHGIAVSCSIWDEAAVPSIAAASDGNAVELGVKFQSALPGHVTGILFYKGPGNGGTHVGNLWTSTGKRLATVTFVEETAEGWQYQALPTPVAIEANTTYIVSYHAPSGRYSLDLGYFKSGGVDSHPLRVLADGEAGGNGVYRYGASGFPNNTWNATNYWVDLEFKY